MGEIVARLLLICTTDCFVGVHGVPSSTNCVLLDLVVSYSLDDPMCGQVLMRIRDINPADEMAWLRMRSELWPDSAEEHSAAIDCYFNGTPTFVDHVVVCENDTADLIGFAELRIRNYAEGSVNTAVPFLEGWFVDASYRYQGAGALLITGAEEWARNLGYSELGSDADIANHSSIAAHVALGFEETGRSVCFLKPL